MLANKIKDPFPPRCIGLERTNEAEIIDFLLGQFLDLIVVLMGKESLGRTSIGSAFSAFGSAFSASASFSQSVFHVL